MKLVSVHGDGGSHRTWEDAQLTSEPWVFFIPPASTVREASGKTWSSDYPVVGLFWPHRFYQVFLLLKATGTDYYCNVIVPPRYHPERGRVEFVDLDLDVLKMEGKVWAADEDEFAVRSHAYPRLWVREAEAAKRRLLEEARTDTGPFSLRTAQVWRARFYNEGLLND